MLVGERQRRSPKENCRSPERRLAPRGTARWRWSVALEMDGGCVAPCETVVSCVDLTGFELRLSGVPARSLFCPRRWRSHWNLLLNDRLQDSETPRALAPGAEMQWVRALSKRKRESTAEG